MLCLTFPRHNNSGKSFFFACFFDFACKSGKLTLFVDAFKKYWRYLFALDG